MWLDDLVTILENAGVGVLNESIFVSSAASIPTGPDAIGPYLSIKETAGTNPDRTQTEMMAPAYERPGAQLVARASDYRTARAMLQAARTALLAVNNQLVNGVWHKRISPMGNFLDLGKDASDGRPQIGLNVLGDKRVS